MNLRDKLLLLDCGEGAQLAWRHTGLNWQNIHHIFLTHTHGDHVFGLPGFLSTMGLLGRTAPLFIHGPSSLRPFVQCIMANFLTDMDYAIHFEAVDATRHQIVFEDRSMEVWTLPLQHRVPCCGYLIREKAGLPHIRRNMIDFYQIPVWAINRHTRLTTPPDPVRSYAYCTDTRPVPQLAEWCRDVSLMYHEATYADDCADRAQTYHHSTARQAAEAAKAASAKRLLIGHFSSRYEDENILLNEARQVFPDTLLAAEGLKITP